MSALRRRAARPALPAASFARRAELERRRSAGDGRNAGRRACEECDTHLSGACQRPVVKEVEEYKECPKKTWPTYGFWKPSRARKALVQPPSSFGSTTQ